MFVRRKPTSLQPGGKQFAISHVQDDVSAAFYAQVDLHAKDLMLPFHCFCNRRESRSSAAYCRRPPRFLPLAQCMCCFWWWKRCRRWSTSVPQSIHEEEAGL